MKLCNNHHKSVFPIGKLHQGKIEEILISKMVYGSIFFNSCFIVLPITASFYL